MLFSQLVCVEDDTFNLIGEQLGIERGGNTFEPAIINFPPFSFHICARLYHQIEIEKISTFNLKSFYVWHFTWSLRKGEQLAIKRGSDTIEPAIYYPPFVICTR